jgi:uncharacterized RDD family membrane protein YckC
MKSIEIKTTQNVVLQYELAELRERIFAFVIDLAVLVVLLPITALIVTTIGLSDTASVVAWFLYVLLFVFYSLGFEVFNNGQSIGKMAMKIRVMKAVGGKATFPDYAARWAFRMVDIYFSFGALASIMITSSSKGQRIGDIVANTAVVKLYPQMDLDLKALLAIRTQQSYSPEFLNAKQLAEEDVLLIKSTLDRLQKYPNRAHMEAAEMLARKVREVLSLNHVKLDSRLFLQTILNDYVVLTR